MNHAILHSGRPLRGEARVPGDKSISHRAMLLNALSQGTAHIRRALLEGDTTASLGCVRALGVEVEVASGASTAGTADLIVHGLGLHDLQEPAGPLDCVRSGTTMRLLCGILAGQSFTSTLIGDPQLLRRPMRRVVEPLRGMGAEIDDVEGHAPLTIHGRPLRGIAYSLPVASAQVKSALLLAGLMADGETTVISPAPSRDHTERMLAAMGAYLAEDMDGLRVRVRPAETLSPLDVVVPGDLSSAAFLIAAGVLVPGSEILLRGVGLNPTRTGLLDILHNMGAGIEVLEEHISGGEPVGDLVVRPAGLSGVDIAGDLIPRAIDEFPILAVLATQAVGTTTIREAAELRVKETDRIAAMTAQLRRLGARIEELPDGLIIEGPTPLRGAVVDSGGDHRVAMSLMIAGLIAQGETTVLNAASASDSYPGFMETLRALGAELEVHA